MHSENFDITIKRISKIEGHADLNLKVREGKVETIELKITENKRFYVEAIEGKDFKIVPQISSRICGTCSTAHLMACTLCVENAMEIKPTEQTWLLRELTMHALMIRDHAMHLYLFCLPDIFKKDSILEFDEDLHYLLHEAFEIKKTGNNLSIAVAGRAVHPTFANVGSFSKIPEKEKLLQSVKELETIRPKVIKLIELFKEKDFKHENPTNYIGLDSEKFDYMRGNLKSSTGKIINKKDFLSHLNKKVIPYSTATGFEFQDKVYMVGALSRLNINKEHLHPNTKKDAKKALDLFPSNNVFHNNLAQAIEILHGIDKSIEIIKNNEFKEEPKPELKPKKGTGVACLEAPRGTLYYKMNFDETGKVTKGDLVIPTAQNQIKMEQDIKLFVPSILNKSEEEIQWEIEKIIRAYDPCMSCATNFLKINWV